MSLYSGVCCEFNEDQDGSTKRLEVITDRMAELADDNPSPYRKAQATISSMHNRLWAYGPWVKLEKAVAQTRNTYEAQLKQGESLSEESLP